LPQRPVTELSATSTKPLYAPATLLRTDSNFADSWQEMNSM